MDVHDNFGASDLVATIKVPAHFDLRLIAEAAGQMEESLRYYVEGWLYVEGVSQQQLDSSYANYLSGDALEASAVRMRLRDNNAAYSTATRALTADYPQLEKDTWPTQDSEAAAWVALPDAASTPWVDLAASERGIDREEYLRRTLVKAKQFKILSAFLTGRRQKFEDAIKAGEDPALDYTLAPAVLAPLQQVATDGMTLPTDQLRDAL